jgi:endonuclease-3
MTMEELTTLPGVGRKTANVVLLNAFGICEGIAVDTHAKRLSNRIGFSKSSQPKKIEQDLLKTIPKKYWPDMNHLFVYHGRAICNAKKPLCGSCPINELCEKNL